MQFTPKAFETTVTKRLSSRYLLSLPEGYSPTGKTRPLVLVVPGSGERGSTAQPNRFAALVVISGGGNPVEVCRLKHVPVWIVHGRKDDVIPVSWAEELGRRLERCSGAGSCHHLSRRRA